MYFVTSLSSKKGDELFATLLYPIEDELDLQANIELQFLNSWLELGIF